MSEPTGQGGCRCGKIRFEVTGPPILTGACHCHGCQRMTASAFSLSAAFSTDQFRVVEGAPVIGGIHGETRHYHCGHCKSWLFTRPEGMDDMVNVRTPMFDEPPSEPPFFEVYRGEGYPWALTGAVHSFEQVPEMDRWPELIRLYSARSGAVMAAGKDQE